MRAILQDVPSLRHLNLACCKGLDDAAAQVLLLQQEGPAGNSSPLCGNTVALHRQEEQQQQEQQQQQEGCSREGSNDGECGWRGFCSPWAGRPQKSQKCSSGSESGGTRCSMTEDMCSSSLCSSSLCSSVCSEEDEQVELGCAPGPDQQLAGGQGLFDRAEGCSSRSWACLSQEGGRSRCLGAAQQPAVLHHSNGGDGDKHNDSSQQLQPPTGMELQGAATLQISKSAASLSGMAGRTRAWACLRSLKALDLTHCWRVSPALCFRLVTERPAVAVYHCLQPARKPGAVEEEEGEEEEEESDYNLE